MAPTKTKIAAAWTPQEDATLIEMKGRKARWTEIMPLLPGRSKVAAQVRFHFLRYPERRQRQLKNLYQNTRVDFQLERETRHRVAVWAEHPDLTGRICGDPPPGRSALDRQLTGAGR